MYSSQHNFGLVETVTPESLGMPGKRVFRLLIDGTPPAAATLWLEKEQLYGLSMAIKKMAENEALRKTGEETQGLEEGEEILRLDDPESLRGNSSEILEFKVGRLGLAVGPGSDHFTIFFHDEQEDEEVDSELESEEEPEESFEKEMNGTAKLQLSLKVAQSDELVKKSLELCASGRGVDALSRHALVASGKVDPNKNGHFNH